MPVIIVPQRWRRQPQGPVRPRAYWLGRGLGLLARPGVADARDLVRGLAPFARSNVALVPSRSSLGIRATSSYGRTAWASNPIATRTTYSLFAVARDGGSSGERRNAVMVGDHDGSGSSHISLAWHTNCWGGGSAGSLALLVHEYSFKVAVDCSGMSTSALQAAMAVRRGNGLAPLFAVDGVLRPAANTSNIDNGEACSALSNTTNVGPPLHANRHPDYVELIAVFRQPLTDAEAIAITRDYYGELFEPDPRRIYVPLAGGASAISRAAAGRGAGLGAGALSSARPASVLGLLAGRAAAAYSVSGAIAHAAAGRGGAAAAAAATKAAAAALAGSNGAAGSIGAYRSARAGISGFAVPGISASYAIVMAGSYGAAAAAGTRGASAATKNAACALAGCHGTRAATALASARAGLIAGRGGPVTLDTTVTSARAAGASGRLRGGGACGYRTGIAGTPASAEEVAAAVWAHLEAQTLRAQVEDLHDFDGHNPAAPLVNDAATRRSGAKIQSVTETAAAVTTTRTA